MKLVIMLVAIYALIINQSLKQKERKNTALRVNPPGKSQNIKSGNNIYFNAAFRPDFTSMPTLNANEININKDLPSGLSKQHTFRVVNAFGTITPQEMLYPVNFYYAPGAGTEGLR